MSTVVAPPQAPPETPSDLKVLWTRLALFLAVVGVLGSLHLSLSMELKACPLCYYQRAFMMVTAGILAIGMFLPGMPLAGQTVLALIPAFAGGSMAAFHTYLELNGTLECPKGITGFLVAPQESLIIFTLILAALLGDLFHRGVYVMQGVGAMLLGLVFCISCVRSVADGLPQSAEEGCRKTAAAKK